MKNSNDTIGNQTHDLPTCSAVPQPTAPPRTPNQCSKVYKIWYVLCVKYCLYVNIDTYSYKVIPDIFTEYGICSEVVSVSPPPKNK